MRAALAALLLLAPASLDVDAPPPSGAWGTLTMSTSRNARLSLAPLPAGCHYSVRLNGPLRNGGCLRTTPSVTLVCPPQPTVFRRFWKKILSLV